MGTDLRGDLLLVEVDAEALLDLLDELLAILALVSVVGAVKQTLGELPLDAVTRQLSKHNSYLSKSKYPNSTCTPVLW